MIEIMAPMFRMDLFEGFIRPTLHNAHVGWGACAAHGGLGTWRTSEHEAV
jgi:hypothetical protein